MTARSCLARFFLLAAIMRCVHADIVVTTTNDVDNANPTCSLREAIIAVNQAADHNGCTDSDGWSNSPFKITFNLAGAGVHRIDLTSALPDVYGFHGTVPVFIDGTTQPGTTCTPVPYPMIVVDNPSNLAVDGLTLSGASGNQVRGLAISGFSNASAIVVNSNYATIGCVVAGLQPGGVNALPNEVGIYVAGSHATIGEASATAWFPNIFAANTNANIQVLGGDDATIAGNYIGVGSNGLSQYPSSVGIAVDSVSRVHIGTGFDSGPPAHQRNVIGVKTAANTVYEIDLESATDTIISGNYIGVGVDGQTVLPIGLGFGININSSSNTLVGCNGLGSWDDCRNIIVAPSTNGAGLTAISNLSAGTAIVSNFINVAADGTTSLADPQYGNTFGIEFSYDTLVARNVIAAGIGLSIGLLSPGAGSNAGFLNPGVAGSGGASLMSADNCLIDVTSSGVTIESGTPAATTFANNYWGASDGPRPSGSGASADALIGFVPFEAVKSVYCGYDQIFGSDFGG